MPRITAITARFRRQYQPEPYGAKEAELSANVFVADEGVGAEYCRTLLASLGRECYAVLGLEEPANISEIIAANEAEKPLEIAAQAAATRKRGRPRTKVTTEPEAPSDPLAGPGGKMASGVAVTMDGHAIPAIVPAPTPAPVVVSVADPLASLTAGDAIPATSVQATPITPAVEISPPSASSEPEITDTELQTAAASAAQRVGKDKVRALITHPTEGFGLKRLADVPQGLRAEFDARLKALK